MFDGRLAVVTGGTRGIGRATAERLRDGGARVLVTGTKPEGPVPEGCDYRVADFGDEASTEAFAALLRSPSPRNPRQQRRRHQPPTLRRHRGGGVPAGAPHQPRGAAGRCRARCLPGMREARWGRIVNVGSMWGVVSKVGRATYSCLEVRPRRHDRGARRGGRGGRGPRELRRPRVRGDGPDCRLVERGKSGPPSRPRCR